MRASPWALIYAGGVWGSGCGWQRSGGLGAAELRELNRIGVNLNQMARAMNAGAVTGARNPGGGRASGGTGGGVAGRGGRVMVDQDVGLGALVRWGGGLLPARPVGTGVAASGERKAGGMDGDPQPGHRAGGSCGADHGSHSRSVPGAQTPGRREQRPGASWRSRCAITR